jgi:hypothetical protein
VLCIDFRVMNAVFVFPGEQGSNQCGHTSLSEKKIRNVRAWNTATGVLYKRNRGLQGRVRAESLTISPELRDQRCVVRASRIGYGGGEEREPALKTPFFHTSAASGW